MSNSNEEPRTPTGTPAERALKRKAPVPVLAKSSDEAQKSKPRSITFAVAERPRRASKPSESQADEEVKPMRSHPKRSPKPEYETFEHTDSPTRSPSPTSALFLSPSDQFELQYRKELEKYDPAEDDVFAADTPEQRSRAHAALTRENFVVPEVEGDENVAEMAHLRRYGYFPYEEPIKDDDSKTPTRSLAPKLLFDPWLAADLLKELREHQFACDDSEFS